MQSCLSSRSRSLVRKPRNVLNFCVTPSAAPRMSFGRSMAKVTSPMRTSVLVSAAVLANEVASSSPPRILDASWYLPSSSGRDAGKEFMSKSLPGARRFDIDIPGLASISDLPHMVERDPAALQTIIPSNRPVVIYSHNGFVGSARAWWHIRCFGFADVRVLDGGARAWEEGGYDFVPGTTDRVTIPDPDYPPSDLKFRPELVWSMEDVLNNLELFRTDPESARTVLDARSPERFSGMTKEVRPGLVSGRIPYSFNTPVTELIDEPTGCMKSTEALPQVFRRNGVPTGGSEKYAVTCGSGVTAAIVVMALYELGHDTVPCYDGSWSEYGKAEFKNPVETGASNSTTP